MKAIPASNVSARVGELIERHDGGDRDTAAVRGYSVSLEALLAPAAAGARALNPALEQEETWQ